MRKKECDDVTINCARQHKKRTVACYLPERALCLGAISLSYWGVGVAPSSVPPSVSNKVIQFQSGQRQSILG